MTILYFTVAAFLFSVLAGIAGALSGLGGAMIVIPTLVLFLQVNMHYAMGAGLCAVMATSMGTALNFLRQGYINIRLGMFLELAAAAGALFGAGVTGLLPTNVLQIIFGCIFMVIAYLAWRGHSEHPTIPTSVDPLAARLQLNSTYPVSHLCEERKAYNVANVIPGFIFMFFAGIFSGLLGIGSGSLKVVAMDKMMKLPFKVSTSTSNFIIGITAAVGAAVFFQQGYMNPQVIFPVMLGVLAGAFLGAQLMPRVPVRPLRVLLAILLLLLALEMIRQGFKGHL